MIEILDEKRWAELAEIFDAEFNAALPNENKATILAATDANGEIEAFIVAETLLRIGQVYVAPAAKGKSYPHRFIKYFLKHIGANTSVIVIASDEKFEGLCEKLKMKEMMGKVFRRDF